MAHAQKSDFVFRRNEQVILNRQWRQFSRLLAAEVCASAVVMLDTPCSEIVWRLLDTHSIRQFPLHFPSRASPCAIAFQLDSTTPPDFRQIWMLTTQRTCVHVTQRTHTDYFRKEEYVYIYVFCTVHCNLIIHINQQNASSSSSSSVGATARCGLWPVEQYLSIFPYLSPTLSIFLYSFTVHVAIIHYLKPNSCTVL